MSEETLRADIADLSVCREATGVHLRYPSGPLGTEPPLEIDSLLQGPLTLLGYYI